MEISEEQDEGDDGGQYKVNARTMRNMKGKKRRYDDPSDENDSSGSAEGESEGSSIVEEEEDGLSDKEVSSAAIPLTRSTSRMLSKRRAAAASMNGNCLTWL